MVEDATLENINNRRIIVYNFGKVIYNEKVDLGSIILFCIKACGSLLKELKDDTDRTFVRHEMALLRQTKDQWDSLIKAFSRAKPSQDSI